MKPPKLPQGFAQGRVGGGSSLPQGQMTESSGVCREFQKATKRTLGSADPEVDGNTQSGKRTRTGESVVSKVLFFRLQNTSLSLEDSLSSPGTGDWNLVGQKPETQV